MSSIFDLPTTTTGWVILIILNFILIFVSYNLAKKKNKNTSTAIVVTLLLGIFAVAYYIFCRPESKRIQTKIIMCKNCGIKINKDDKFCFKCGHKIRYA